MAITTHSACIPQPARSAAGAWLARLLRLASEALDAQRWRDFDREAARLLEQSGGRLTDSLEREISRRLLEF